MWAFRNTTVEGPKRMEMNWTLQFNSSSRLFLEVPQAGCRNPDHTAHDHQPEVVPLGEWSLTDRKQRWRGTRDRIPVSPQHSHVEGFLDSSVGKESTCNAGDLALIPGLGRSPGGGKGYSLQYPGLENSRDCIDHGVSKTRTWRRDFHSHFNAQNESFRKWDLWDVKRWWGWGPDELNQSPCEIRAQRDPWGHSKERWPPKTRQGAGVSHQTRHLPALSWTSSLQNCGEIKLCCL